MRLTTFIVIIAVLLGLGGAAYAYGIPEFHRIQDKRELDQSLISTGKSIDDVSKSLPRSTRVAGAFVDSGTVLLTDVKGDTTTNAELTVGDTGYRIYFAGKLAHYKITVTEVSDSLMKRPIAVYDSKTKQVTD